jgi:hypothetical protein
MEKLSGSDLSTGTTDSQTKSKTLYFDGLPSVFTPEQVAAHFGWSPRLLRQKVREIGACRIMGNRMVMTEADIALLLDATRPTGKRDTPVGTDTANTLHLLNEIERRSNRPAGKGRR